MSLRLFTGIVLTKAARDSFRRIDLNVRGLKPVALDKLHLTLHFIGEVDKAQAAALSESLARVTGAPFALRVGGWGCFPPRGKPRILWVGLHAPPAELFALHGAVGAALAGQGLRLERRAYHPHLTVARCGNVRPATVTKLMQRYGDFETPVFKVDRFVLFRSELRPEGAVYEEWASYPLKERVGDGREG